MVDAGTGQLLVSVWLPYLLIAHFPIARRIVLCVGAGMNRPDWQSPLHIREVHFKLDLIAGGGL